MFVSSETLSIVRCMSGTPLMPSSISETPSSFFAALVKSSDTTNSFQKLLDFLKVWRPSNASHFKTVCLNTLEAARAPNPGADHFRGLPHQRTQPDRVLEF
eukprot:4333334-Alexandrium_andersonii.AAC.1